MPVAYVKCGRAATIAPHDSQRQELRRRWPEFPSFRSGGDAPVSRSKKQAEALHAVLVSAAIEFAGPQRTIQACDRLVTKLLSIWAISAQLVAAQVDEHGFCDLDDAPLV